MHPVAKAIWYIESHFGRAITLSEIAGNSGMSRHHLSRRFSEMTGQNLNRYLRARRLAEAARQIAGGAENILKVALDAGYGSHEAFTRAFREEFGLTPETLRTRRDLSGLTLQEPIRMSAIEKSTLPSPRIETLDVFLITGLGTHFEPGTAAGIPALRIPTAPLKTPNGLLSDGIGAFIGRAGLHSLAALARWKADRAGLYAPEHFAGIVAGDAVDQAYLVAILKHLPEGTTEVMLHPGTNNLLLQAECNWDHDFIKELEAITAPEIRTLMTRNHIECTNFQQ